MSSVRAPCRAAASAAAQPAFPPPTTTTSKPASTEAFNVNFHSDGRKRCLRRAARALIERMFDGTDAPPRTRYLPRKRGEIGFEPRRGDAVRVVDQSVPGLLPSVRLLLRAPYAHVLAAQRYRSLGLASTREGKPRPGPAARTCEPPLAGRTRRDRNGAGPLSADRRPLSRDPRDPGRTRKGTNRSASHDAFAARGT